MHKIVSNSLQVRKGVGIMRRSNNLMQLTWILVIALMLLSLFTFISCADDIVSIQIIDDENPEEPKGEEDPNNDGGGGGGMVLSRQIVPYV